MNERRWRALRRNRAAMVGAGVIALVLLAALLADVVAPHAPAARQPDLRAEPSAKYWLGTDDNGFDVFSRMVHGARSSLAVAVFAVALALGVGVPLGLVAGWRGGWTDGLIMRAMDVLLAFPSVLLAIAIAAALDERSLRTVVIAVAVVMVAPFVRQVRAAVIQVRNHEYVTASRALGSGPARILFRTVLPNCLAPILVLATLSTGVAILDAAGLSFLGLGPPDTAPEWGVMLTAGFRFMLRPEQWILLPPGIAIAVTVLGFNLFGDGLRDAYDPRRAG